MHDWIGDRIEVHGFDVREVKSKTHDSCTNLTALG
jgi:hypothetical protein